MRPFLAAACALVACPPLLAAGLYHENFQDGRAQFWQASPAEAFTIETSPAGNSFYRASSRPANVSFQVSTLKLEPPADFRVTVRLADNLVRPTYLVFRATPDFAYDHGRRRGTGYAFGIDCGAPFAPLGAFYFYKQVKGHVLDIQPWKYGPLKCSADIDDADELEITVKGDTFQLGINGHGVFRYTDPRPLAPGRIGLYNISDPDLATYSDFDRVVIHAAGGAFAALDEAIGTPAEALSPLDPQGEPLTLAPAVPRWCRPHAPR